MSSFWNHVPEHSNNTEASMIYSFIATALRENWWNAFIFVYYFLIMVLYCTRQKLMGNFSLLESYCSGIVCGLFEIVNLKSVYVFPPIVKIFYQLRITFGTIWQIEPCKLYFSIYVWNIVSLVFAEIQLFVTTMELTPCIYVNSLYKLTYW